MTIPGVVLSGDKPSSAPIILVIAREKTGKSTLAATAFDWPNKGDRPLVIAADESGPDAAAQIGVRLPHIKVKDEPGERYKEKLSFLAGKLETHFANGKKPYSSLIYDCASTSADKLIDEAHRFGGNPDPRSHYGDMNTAMRSFFFRMVDLNVPTIWLAWLREPETVKEKGASRFVPGGAQIAGVKFRELLSGRAHVIALLEKNIAKPNDPNASSDGFVRTFRTKQYAGINCETRYRLPNPMPANLGLLLHYVINGYSE